ncbi:MAG TPA: c-type cytochrome [Trueperaceae bacterium]
MNGSERSRRYAALAVLAVMMVIFIVLSAFSFLGSRDQVTPDTVSYASYGATDGKRVLQAYNCMGCHTIVGNGAYFAPDLTDIYERAGPAWLAAFLPSASTWPTEAAVRTQLMDSAQLADTGVDDIDEYFARFPGARERVVRRGGSHSLMPTLPITAQETRELIAFFKYTSMMNTEGWPPEPKIDGLQHPLAAPAPDAASNMKAAEPRAVAVDEASDAAEPAELAKVGEGIATEYGCFSCHASDSSRLVGPGWGGLYGTERTLSNGSSIIVDEAYLETAIREPSAHVAQGFPAGVMPSYEGILTDEEIDALVAYIRSLEEAR